MGPKQAKNPNLENIKYEKEDLSSVPHPNIISLNT